METCATLGVPLHAQVKDRLVIERENMYAYSPCWVLPLPALAVLCLILRHTQTTLRTPVRRARAAGTDNVHVAPCKCEWIRDSADQLPRDCPLPPIQFDASGVQSVQVTVETMCQCYHTNTLPQGHHHASLNRRFE